MGEESRVKEQSDPILHLHIELLKLTGNISGKGSLSYYTVNILNTFAGKTSATGDVCWIYYVNSSRSLETNCTFLLFGKRQSQWNKHNFCCFDWSTTYGDKVLTENWVMLFLHIISICWVLLLYLNALKAFVPPLFKSCWAFYTLISFFF